MLGRAGVTIRHHVGVGVGVVTLEDVVTGIASKAMPCHASLCDGSFFGSGLLWPFLWDGRRLWRPPPLVFLPFFSVYST